LYLARLDPASARAVAQHGAAEAVRRVQLPAGEKPEALIGRKAVVRWRTAD
jgi:hypothetical protein